MGRAPVGAAGAPSPALVVAMVTDAIEPFHKGGKETRTRHLATGLAALGFEVHVYTMGWWQGSGPWVADGVTYHALCRAYPLYAGDRRSIRQALMFALASFRLLTARFDVLEADHMPHLQLFPIRLVAWLRRRPLLCSWHEYWGGAYWREYLGGLGGTVAALIERATVRLPEHLVALTPGTVDRLEREGIPRSRTTVVPPGIDLASIDAAQPGRDGFDVLYVGRLLSHKRVDVLLEALAWCRQQGLAASCGVVGNGPERDRLAQKVDELGIGDLVQLLEPVEHPSEVYGLMKASRLLVLPSVREGFGIVVAEALACGTPVITSDHPDNHARDLVEDGVTGWRCQPEAASLGAAIAKALAAGRAHGAAERRVAAERLDWQASVEQFAEVLERFAVRRGR